MFGVQFAGDVAVGVIDADTGDALQDFHHGTIGQLADVCRDDRVDDFGGDFLHVLRRLQGPALTTYHDLGQLIVGLGRAVAVRTRSRIGGQGRPRRRPKETQRSKCQRRSAAAQCAPDGQLDLRQVTSPRWRQALLRSDHDHPPH